MLGTLINAAAVAAGGVAGLMIHSKLPERFMKIIFQAAGLFTLAVGMASALKTGNFLIAGLSLLLGAITGELIHIEAKLEKSGEDLKKLIKSDNARFSEGVVTPFLLFCIGPMTILGCFEEGLGNPPNLLLIKSMLDGFVSISFAAALGVGVIFSIIPLLIVQGALTLAASSLQSVFTENVITELTAVGGLLLLGLGINLLDIKKIKVANLLPAMVFVVIVKYFFP